MTAPVVDAAPVAHAPLVVPARAEAILAWAVHTGAGLALDAGDVALVAPHIGGTPQALEVPRAVRAGLAVDWRVVRALLEVTRDALGRRGLPGWPGSLNAAHGAALLTVAAWADLVRLGLADDEHAAWSALARAEAERGTPRWVAAVSASETLAGPHTPCPAVRARHLAAIRAAVGAADA